MEGDILRVISRRRSSFALYEAFDKRYSWGKAICSSVYAMLLIRNLLYRL
jgi:hypothetical protein